MPDLLGYGFIGMGNIPFALIDERSRPGATPSGPARGPALRRRLAYYVNELAKRLQPLIAVIADNAIFNRPCPVLTTAVGAAYAEST